MQQKIGAFRAGFIVMLVLITGNYAQAIQSDPKLCPLILAGKRHIHNRLLSETVTEIKLTPNPVPTWDDGPDDAPHLGKNCKKAGELPWKAPAWTTESNFAVTVNFTYGGSSEISVGLKKLAEATVGNNWEFGESATYEHKEKFEVEAHDYLPTRGNKCEYIERKGIKSYSVEYLVTVARTYACKSCTHQAPLVYGPELATVLRINKQQVHAVYAGACGPRAYARKFVS